MSRQTDADALIAALAEEARRSAGQKPGPEPEELLGYLEGRLSAEDEERVSRQLAADPEAARALLDLADFEAAGAAAGTQPPELAVRAGWRDLKDKLPGADRRPRRLPPVLSTIAASLLVATLGLGYWIGQQQGAPSRPVTMKNLNLYASRAGTEQAVDLSPGEIARLVIPLGEPSCPSYTAEIEGPRDRDRQTFLKRLMTILLEATEIEGPRDRDRQTVELQPDQLGNLVLGLSEPGTYTLHLYGCEPRHKIDEHHFQIKAHGG